MPIQDVTIDQLIPANLIADTAVPLMYDTIMIGEQLPLGSLISKDPTTQVGMLVTDANRINLYGVLRDNIFEPNILGVVYISGAFIADTLKTDADTSVAALTGRLRELGIFAMPSVHYPSYEIPSPVPLIQNIVPETAAAGSGAQQLTVNGRNFTNASTVTFDGTPVATVFVNASRLTATITPVAPAGNKPVIVMDNNIASNVINFIVT